MGSNKIEKVKGIAQGSSSAPPRKRNQEKPKSFWTSCDKCNTKYEYPMFYLNRTIWCQFSKERNFFRAVEKATPPSVANNLIHELAVATSDVNGIDSGIKSNSATPPAAIVGPIALLENLRRGLFMAAAGESSGTFQSAAKRRRNGKGAGGRMGSKLNNSTRKLTKSGSRSMLKDKAIHIITSKLQQLKVKGN